jgi:DNA-binding NtrC family response regulator
MVAAGTFRADLFYRLNVLPIRVPPLRERLDDLEALAEALADDISRRSGLANKTLGGDALEHLAGRPWPGNIRELRNVLEQATLMTDDLVLTAAHFGKPEARLDAPIGLPKPAGSAAAPTLAGESGSGVGTAVQRPAAPALKPLPQAVAELEARSIREALALTGGNKVAASRLLGIARATLYEKLASLPD